MDSGSGCVVEEGMARILAVDWGKVRLGLAVSDELGLIARGLGALPAGKPAQALDAIAEQVRTLEVTAIVVGLPRNMDGTDGPSAEKARAFARAVKDRVGLPVHLWDERLTTLAAERQLIAEGVRRRRRRAVVDSMAATLILQGFLDRQRAEGKPLEAP
jgi:putative holliday junction resolvase